MALFLIDGLLASLVVLYVVRFQKGLAQSLSKICGVCVLVLLTFALAIVMSRSPWYAVLIPLTVTALILTIAYNPPFALLLSLTPVAGHDRGPGRQPAPFAGPDGRTGDGGPVAARAFAPAAAWSRSASAPAWPICS